MLQKTLKVALVEAFACFLTRVFWSDQRSRWKIVEIRLRSFTGDVLFFKVVGTRHRTIAAT